MSRDDPHRDALHVLDLDARIAAIDSRIAILDAEMAALARRRRAARIELASHEAANPLLRALLDALRDALPSDPPVHPSPAPGHREPDSGLAVDHPMVGPTLDGPGHDEPGNDGLGDDPEWLTAPRRRP